MGNNDQTAVSSATSNMFDATADIASKFRIENITVVKPPLLKVFYWESLDIETLNSKLLGNNINIEHHLNLPTTQLNSKPLKIVLWLRSLSSKDFTMRLKRIQNCQCAPIQTRVGFNQFRHLYHCPHRRLINIAQEKFVLKPNDLVAMSVVAYFYILGQYRLSYELRVSDCRVIFLHFHVDIVTFDPEKIILTSKLIPVDMKEHRAMAQPIWIRNITMENLQLKFCGKHHGFRMINPKIEIPRQSVWPLIVEYKPNDFVNDIELIQNYGPKSCGTRYIKPITAEGFLPEVGESLEVHPVPVLDYSCADYLYVLYPNQITFSIQLNDERTQMVALHNTSQKCMEFRWQNYTINDYFSFTFEPAQFTLKAHHSKLCVVHVKSYNKPLHFKRIPAVLEVHRILDKETQIAQQLLTEVESLDDPKWAEDSYVEHVLLQIDLKVEFPKLQRVNVMDASKEAFNNDLEMKSIFRTDCTTIFEKLFWEYLANSQHQRNTSKIPRNLNYEQVLNQKTQPKKKEPSAEMDRQKAFNLLSYLTAESCRDLRKNYYFISGDMVDI